MNLNIPKHMCVHTFMNTHACVGTTHTAVIVLMAVTCSLQQLPEHKTDVSLLPNR